MESDLVPVVVGLDLVACAATSIGIGIKVPAVGVDTLESVIMLVVDSSVPVCVG